MNIAFDIYILSFTVKPVVSKVRNFRLTRDDFDLVRIIGRGAFGEVWNYIIINKTLNHHSARNIVGSWQISLRWSSNIYMYIKNLWPIECSVNNNRIFKNRFITDLKRVINIHVGYAYTRILCLYSTFIMEYMINLLRCLLLSNKLFMVNIL